MSNTLFVFYDTETTGLDVNKDSILEFAGRIYNSGNDWDSYKDLMCTHKDLKDIPKAAQDIHHITMDELTTLGRPFLEQWDTFCAWLEKKLVYDTVYTRVCMVAHNGTRYDEPILRANVKRYDGSIPSYMCFADSLPLLRALSENRGKSCSLEMLRQRYKVDNNKTQLHRALADVDLLIDVWNASKLPLEKLLPPTTASLSSPVQSSVSSDTK